MAAPRADKRKAEEEETVPTRLHSVGDWVVTTSKDRNRTVSEDVALVISRQEYDASASVPSVSRSDAKTHVVNFAVTSDMYFVRFPDADQVQVCS